MDRKILPDGINIHLLCMLWAKQAKIYKKNNEYFFELINVDPKILYMTARPHKIRNFVHAEKFLSIWSKNNTAFEQEPPEIALVYDAMQKDTDGISRAIPLQLTKPHLDNRNNWCFTLINVERAMDEGDYENIALFIDWLPTNYCPEPIQKLFPDLLNEKEQL